MFLTLVFASEVWSSHFLFDSGKSGQSGKLAAES